MAKKVRMRKRTGGRRPVIGGAALSVVVLAGLCVFLLFGAEYQHESADGLTAETLVFIFIPAVLVDNDDSTASIHAIVITFAALALIGAILAISRREWTPAWVGSLFGTIFGPLSLIGVYLIGTSDLDFRQSSVLEKLGESRGSPSPRKDPFVGVIAVVVVSLLIGRSLNVMLVAITGSLTLSLLIVVCALMFIYLAVTTAHAKLRS